MRTVKVVFVLVAVVAFSCHPKVEKSQELNGHKVHNSPVGKHLFLDVHNLEPGKVTFAAVSEAHQKDLATQHKYGVNFIKFWVDEAEGKVYCLAEAPDSLSVYQTYKDAHGLVPDFIHDVTGGEEGVASKGMSLFLDVHNLGAGNVSVQAVAAAHAKDLAVQQKRNVNFINYWVNEKSGAVVCLSEAKDAASVYNTHKEAHGLLPDEIHLVKQGQ